MKKWILDGHTPVEVADVLEWGRWFETADKARTVALNQWNEDGPHPIRVSTVFLGIDHNFVGRGPPILFETMIFASGLPDLDDYQERYATWDEAEAGHARAVARVEAALAEVRV